ncbi:MAG TPA: septation protein IspZ [Rhizomicrobium sp.]|jgi:intracellular septation protein|nr:septation protein IspZ [Rhizomicrobium sp.]
MNHTNPLQVAKPIVFDLLAAITFAASFFIAKHAFGFSGLHSVYIAAVTGIATGVIQLFIKKAMREEIGPLHWLSLGVVLILGLMTIALHNEHFIKLKPSVIDFSVGLFMATRDWMTPYIPQDVRRHLDEKLIYRAEKGWAILMFGFSLTNVAVAFLFDFAIWTLYATFVPTIIIVVLFFVQYRVFERLSDRAARAAVEGP